MMMMKSFLIILNLIILSIISVKSNSAPSLDFPFSQQDAESYLRYSYASYCPLAEIVTWTCPTCADKQFDDFRLVAGIYNSTTDTQALVGYESDKIVVAFRGSIDIESWVTNLQFLQIPYPLDPSANVHSGFYEGWASVREQIKNAIDISIKSCGSECNQIMVTGHSLGGALATLAVAEIQFWYEIPAFVYTFGSPRVGDNNFAAYFNGLEPNVHRVTFENDLVPHVPPQNILSYHHVPSEVFFSDNSTYILCNDSGEDPKCADGVPGYSIYDHLNYFGMKCCCR